jgi:hypothetical protein
LDLAVSTGKVPKKNRQEGAGMSIPAQIAALEEELMGLIGSTAFEAHEREDGPFLGLERLNWLFWRIGVAGGRLSAGITAANSAPATPAPTPRPLSPVSASPDPFAAAEALLVHLNELHGEARSAFLSKNHQQVSQAVKALELKRNLPLGATVVRDKNGSYIIRQPCRDTQEP